MEITPAGVSVSLIKVRESKTLSSPELGCSPPPKGRLRACARNFKPLPRSFPLIKRWISKKEESKIVGSLNKNL